MDDNSTSTKALDPYADNPDVVLREHVYDGIQEYDQKLPNWWLWTLYIFIILFVLYWVLYYQAGIFADDRSRVDAQFAEVEAARAAKLEELMGSMDDSVLWKMSRNTQMTGEGKATYDLRCSTCHAPDLRGSATGLPQHVGLPLNDAEWKYGAEPMKIFELVMNGSPDPTKGMAAWKDLGPDTVAKVVAYVLSKHPIPEGVAVDG